MHFEKDDIDEHFLYKKTDLVQAGPREKTPLTFICNFFKAGSLVSRSQSYPVENDYTDIAPMVIKCPNVQRYDNYTGVELWDSMSIERSNFTNLQQLPVKLQSGASS